MTSTTKTTLKFLHSIVRRCSPFPIPDLSVEDIFNYLNYSDMLSSSGQPTQDQFTLIARAGYSVVINLATQDKIEFPVKDEASIVTDLGMVYIPIPVDFFNPSPSDFDRFVSAMKDVEKEKVWVHCMVNARASAFIYRYRLSVLGHDKEDALWDLREIWEPFGVWKTFVYKTISGH